MIGAVVQARMGSTRLPGKVLMPAAGRPLLAHLLARLAHAETVERIVVATSDDARDDPVAALCAELDVPVFRGSELDVLDRYYQAARRARLDLVVRVTADCPLVDPGIVDAMVRYALARRDDYDLVTNRYPLTFPDGLDLDVIPFAALELAWRHAREPRQREHVIPFFWDTSRRVHNLEHPDDLYSRYRWTLDYPEDYAVIRAIIEALDAGGSSDPFPMETILEYLGEHPALIRANAEYIVAQNVPRSGRTLTGFEARTTHPDA